MAIPIWYYWGTISRWFTSDKESVAEESDLSDTFQKPLDKKPTFFEKYATKNNLLTVGGGALVLGGACYAYDAYSSKKKAREALVNDPAFQKFVKSKESGVNETERCFDPEGKRNETKIDQLLQEFRTAQLNDSEFKKFLQSKRLKTADGEETPEFSDAKTDELLKEFEKNHEWKVTGDQVTAVLVAKTNLRSAGTVNGKPRSKSEKNKWGSKAMGWLDYFGPLYNIPGFRADSDDKEAVNSTTETWIRTPLRLFASAWTYWKLWCRGWMPFTEPAMCRGNPYRLWPTLMCACSSWLKYLVPFFIIVVSGCIGNLISKHCCSKK